MVTRHSQSITCSFEIKPSDMAVWTTIIKSGKFLSVFKLEKSKPEWSVFYTTYNFSGSLDSCIGFQFQYLWHSKAPCGSSCGKTHTNSK